MMKYPAVVHIVPAQDKSWLEWKNFENEVKRGDVGANTPALKFQIEPLICNGTVKDILLNLNLCSLAKIQYIVIPPTISDKAISNYLENYQKFINDGRLSSTCELIYYNYSQSISNKMVPGFGANELSSLQHNYEFTLIDVVDEVSVYLRNKMYGRVC